MAPPILTATPTQAHPTHVTPPTLIATPTNMASPTHMVPLPYSATPTLSPSQLCGPAHPQDPGLHGGRPLQPGAPPLSVPWVFLGTPMLPPRPQGGALSLCEPCVLSIHSSLISARANPGGLFCLCPPVPMLGFIFAPVLCCWLAGRQASRPVEVPGTCFLSLHLLTHLERGRSWGRAPEFLGWAAPSSGAGGQ